MDKAFVGTLKDGTGRRFFAVERNGRQMPVLNGKGEVEFWPKWDGYADRTAPDFSRVLQVMDKPETLKVVNPAPKGGRGPDGLYDYQHEMIQGLDLASGPDWTSFTWVRGSGK